jgi:peptide deformylase
MTIRKIAQIGHPVLRQRAREVTREELASPAMQTLIDDMIETMRDAQGAGLAAIQVYEPVRIVVVEVGANQRYPYKPPIPLTVLVNPELRVITDERFDNYEGCLSVPDLRGLVPRATVLEARYWDRHGNPVETVAKGLTACTYQHEVDHLDGVLFVDRVVQPTSLSTWKDWDRYHREPFVARVQELVARHGS